MEHEIERLHRRLARSKFAIFLIIGFLAFLTYLLIVVANQVTQEASLDFRSRASEPSYLGALRGNNQQLQNVRVNGNGEGGQVQPYSNVAQKNLRVTTSGAPSGIVDEVKEIPLVACGESCMEHPYSNSGSITTGRCAPGQTCQESNFPGFGQCYSSQYPGTCKIKSCGEACQSDDDCMGGMKCTDENGDGSKFCIQHLSCPNGQWNPFKRADGAPTCANEDDLKTQFAKGSYKGCCLEIGSAKSGTLCK